MEYKLVYAALTNVFYNREVNVYKIKLILNEILQILSVSVIVFGHVCGELLSKAGKLVVTWRTTWQEWVGGCMQLRSNYAQDS
jgi:hypothetical protein